MLSTTNSSSPVESTASNAPVTAASPDE